MLMKVVIFFIGMCFGLKQSEKKEKLAAVMNVYMEHEDLDDGDIERRKRERENDIQHIKEIRSSNANSIKSFLRIVKQQSRNAFKINQNMIINSKLQDF